MALTEVNPHSPVHLEVTMAAGATPITAAVMTLTLTNPDGDDVLVDVAMVHVENGLYRYKVPHTILTVAGIYTVFYKAAFGGDEARERAQFLVRY